MKPTDCEKTLQVLNIFLIIETSDSMPETFVEQANKMILDTVKDLNNEHLDTGVQIKFSILEFNSKASWLNPEGPQNIKNFTFVRSLTSAPLTNMGAALTELNLKLSPKAFLGSAIDNYLPIIFFISGGECTDNYMESLEEIRKNEWFTRARKIAFAVGDAADITMLANVTGSIESVITMEDLSHLAKLITFIDIPDSMLKCRHTPDDTNALIDSIVNELEGNDS